MSVSALFRSRCCQGFPDVPHRQNESGSSLVLAIVFLTVVSVVMVALVTWVGNDLRNTAKFTAAQSFQSTANSASEVALQNVRYNFMAQTLNASPPAPCWTTSPTPSLLSLNGQTVDSWCTTAWTTSPTQGRVVTISTCLSSMSAANCAVNPLLQSIISVGDELSTGIASCSPVQTAVSSSSTTCGTAMKIDSWSFGVRPPSVSSVIPGVASCVAGNPVAIVGTNFTGASSVTFELVSGGSANQLYAASSFSVVSSTSITACTPSTGTGNAYVAVTTPAGPSILGPTFSY